ncbi:MAG: pre-peptidase C-terminal domain-containing protein [Myxococcales bacterium]|nr:pre-peptidase C-terminal domain-containing protein [Myxococcales bacterium]
MLLALLVGGALALASVSCDSNGVQGDGGPPGDVPQGSCTGGIDKSIDISTAISLPAGEEHTGYICPTGDLDYFKVTVNAGDRLLRIELTNTAAVGTVQPTYLVLDPNEKTVAQAPSTSSKKINALHCLAPGDYYVQVQDAGNDARDGNNPYKLKVTSEKEPDANEPNNTVAEAKPAGASATGAISCTGDVDYFSITVGANQLIDIKLTTSAASPVDIKYTIVNDKDEEVGTQTFVEGTTGQANLVALHAVPAAGTYYVRVEDAGGDDSDPNMTYTLTLGTMPETDANDQGTRNDTAATATPLNAWNSTATVTGEVGSRGDVDWYVINGMTVSPTAPAVIEVTMTFSGQTDVDPSFSLIYGHAGTPCTKDACCRVLEPNGAGCVNPFSCLGKSPSCINKGDLFCTDQTCSPSAGANCSVERRCAGAAVCLPSKFCGAEYAIRSRDNGGSVRTAVLVTQPGPWYIRAGDLANDEYAHGVKYTLQVRARPDPDGAKEPDSEVFPDRCGLFAGGASGTKEPFDYHFDKAKAKGIPTIALGQTVTGFISHEGDMDFYRLPNPCPNADCVLTLTYNHGPNCPTGGGMIRRCQDPQQLSKYLGLDFFYTIRRQNGDEWTELRLAPGAAGSWGYPNQCVYSYAQHGANDYIITVHDEGDNNWSWSCNYSFSITVGAQGCAAPCVTHPVSGNCDTP